MVPVQRRSSSLPSETALPAALAAELAKLGLSELPPTPEAWRTALQRLAIQSAISINPDVAADDADHDLNLLEATADAVVIFAPEAEQILAANTYAGNLYGYSADEMIGMSLLDISTNSSASMRRVEDLIRGEAEMTDGWHRFETLQKRRDGSTMVVYVQARKIRFRGQPAILSINRDVTEMQRVQRALASSEERFARIFDASPVASAVVATTGHILDVNDAMLDLTERLPEQLIGHHLLELKLYFGTEDTPLDSMPPPPVREQPMRLTTPEGGMRYVLASAAWIEVAGETSLLVQMVDITEQKRVETELRASEARYRRMLIDVERQARETALLDQVRTMMAREENLQAVVRAVVQGIRDHFGYDLVSIYLQEKDHLTLQHQVGYEDVIERIPVTSGVMARALRTGSPVLLPDVRKDPEFLGAIPGIRSEVCVPLFVGDMAAGVLNVETIDEELNTHDLDLFLALGAHVSLAIQRARLVSELQLSNERYDSLLSSVQEVVFQTDAEGRWIYLNPAWERLSGYTVETMIGQLWTDLMHPDDQMTLLLRFSRLIRRRETYYQMSARFLTATGDERWCEISGRLNYSDDGVYRGSAGTGSDITERHNAELREREQRQLAEALAANAASAASANTVDEVIRSALEHLPRIIPHFDSLRVALVEYGMAHMVAFAAPGSEPITGTGINIWELEAASLPLVSLTERPAARVHPNLTENAIALPDLAWVRSAIVAPLRSKELLLGYLYLDCAQPNRFTDTQAQWVQGFADQLGTALHNLRLRADMATYAQELELRVAERTDQFRQAKEQVETILNTSPDAIALVSAAGRILQANRAFAETFRAAASLDDHPSLDSFMAIESALPLRDAIASALHGHSQRLKLTARRADGSSFPVDVAVDPLVRSEASAPTVVCSLHDITEHQVLEDSLRAALDQERRLVDLKSRFGIMVSHEFRTPLATIQTSTDLLENYVDRLTPERRHEALETISRQVRHLTTMLDDILSISKADTIGMDFKPTPTDLSELCQSIAEEVRWLDHGHHLVRYSAEGARAQFGH